MKTETAEFVGQVLAMIVCAGMAIFVVVGLLAVSLTFWQWVLG